MSIDQKLEIVANLMMLFMHDKCYIYTHQKLKCVIEEL